MSWIREKFTFEDMQRLLSKLAEKVKAFNGLSPSEIGEILAHAEKCTFGPGTNIVKEGNVGTHMYIIIEGDAAVTKTGRGGPVELARLGPPDSFGEMGLADNEVRSATVTALTDCTLVRLNDQVICGRPEVAAKVYRNVARVLSARLRNADETLVWRL